MTTSTKLEPGALLEGRYRLTEMLGGGGMGQVWEAVHTSLGHRVAIKVLHGNIMSSAEPRARFEREARLMAQLGEASRHITRVIEHGVLEDGVPFLVMERLRGEDLATRLKRERAMPLAKVAEILGQLCKALSAAHAQGVVHRDIKPANIFLVEDEDGRDLVKLLDFGVAKALSEAGEQTVSGQVIGTPNYMSPEQLTGDAPVDARADVFAAGSIAYRCAVGKTAFGKGSISEMAMRIVSMNPAAPSSVNPLLPLAFDGFIQKALAKNPADRFQSARDLADALHQIVADLGSSAFQVGELLGPVDSGQHSLNLASQTGMSQASSRRPPPTSPSGGRRSAVWMGAVGLVVVCAAAMVLYLNRRPAPRDDAEAARPKPAVSAPLVVSPPVVPAASSVAAVQEAPSAAAVASASAPASAEHVRVAGPARGGAAKVAPATPAKVEEPAKPAPPAVQDTWRKKDEM